MLRLFNRSKQFPNTELFKKPPLRADNVPSRYAEVLFSTASQ